MKKIVLKPVEGGQKSVELKIGKTIIGRGPLLECSDKKVSRNHAVLEVTEDGEVFLTPTHVNPCFYQVQGKGPSKVMKKDKQQLLQSGDSIALLPNSYKYIVEINSSSSSSISPGFKESQPADDADNKDSIAEKPATAVIPAEEARKNGSAEENHHSTTTVITKTENGDRGSSKEASPEAVSKVTPAARKAVGGAPANKAGDGESKSSTGGTRTLPRWLLDSAAKSATTAASAKAKASSVQKDKKATAEPATVKKAGRTVGKEPATKARGRQAKESESEAEEDKPNQKSEDEAEEEEEEEESEEEYTPKRKKKPEQAERHPATASSGNRKGSRSSRQNRGLMQKISLDDFIASDDDEWDNSSDEWKPKKRRKQVDDSGSDWEEENRRTKKAPRYAASDSDSASDWERASRRKKPATRTRNRRKRSTSESGSSEESEKAPVRRGQRRQPAKRPNCKYGRKCFRKSVQHLKQFSHPKDSDYENSSGDEDEDRDEEDTKDHADGSDAESDRGKRQTKRPSATAPSKKRAKTREEESDDDDNDKSGNEDDRPMCRYGKECFRKNAQHLKNFKHPPAASKKKEPAKQTTKKAKSRGKTKCSSEDEEVEEEAASGDEYEWKDDDDTIKKSNEEDSSSEQKKATPAKRKRATERLAASAADD
ncbi:aprataxin and PNK-like factor isoform X2 [Dermacentor albipictus]|uniref:aprataxin and PNK-like factor isoform X2 n=1 Tax=Dermacentor albipictus TaxID=60249 RepID=UPI0031FE160B